MRTARARCLPACKRALLALLPVFLVAFRSCPRRARGLRAPALITRFLLLGAVLTVLLFVAFAIRLAFPRSVSRPVRYSLRDDTERCGASALVVYRSGSAALGGLFTFAPTRGTFSGRVGASYISLLLFVCRSAPHAVFLRRKCRPTAQVGRCALSHLPYAAQDSRDQYICLIAYPLLRG